MKLTSLYSGSKKDNIQVLREYLEKLKRLKTKSGLVLSEAKITITIDDDRVETGIPESAKSQFIEQAKAIGEFDNSEWIRNLVNGMKQAGVQGFNEITEDEKPVSQKEMRKLIGLLVNLLGK